MAKSGLPKSIRKHVRTKKAEIRRRLISDDEKKRAIKDLYDEVLKQVKPKKNDT